MKACERFLRQAGWKESLPRQRHTGTGKLGDLAGFTSAIILAMIAMLIGYEAIIRFMSPVPIHFNEVIPIAVVGLMVNIVSAWLLSGGHHTHSHGHDHGEQEEDDGIQYIHTSEGQIAVSIFEDGVPPVFRIAAKAEGQASMPQNVTLITIRPDHTREVFAFALNQTFLESTSHIPEPHDFKVIVKVANEEHAIIFEEHDHSHENGADTLDHNMRAAYVHVLADAAISVLAIIGLLLVKTFGWLWMDPLAGIMGAFVIASWSYGLIRDTGGILMDMNINEEMVKRIKAAIEIAGDSLNDLHVWRLGPGHFGAIVSVVTNQPQHDPTFYRHLLRHFKGLSHVTVEVSSH